MNDLIFGILTIFLCFVGYSFAWKFQIKENYKIGILLLIICGLLLRIYTSCDFFLHTWDERYHALVAKNLINHPLIPTLYDNPILPYNFKDWVGNHIWLHKQPLPLWTMAASMWAFGVNEIALRMPSIILSSIGIWLTFSIGSFLFNKKIGFLAAFLFSINGLIIELSAGRTTSDHIDIFFLFFIELAIFFTIRFAQRRNTIYNVLAGMSIGAAILSKWLPALIVIPIWMLVVFDSKNFKLDSYIFQFIILIATCVIVFLPWQIYISMAFPLEAGWEADYNFRHITEIIEGQSGPFYYYLGKIRIDYGEIIYLPLVVFLWKTYKNYYDKKRLAVCIWFLIPLLFFSLVKTKMQAYILFTSPALFLITSEFYYTLSEKKKHNKLKWLLNLILILIIALPVRYSIERTKPFDNRNRKPQWVVDLKKLNREKINNAVLFNYDYPIEAMFYTDDIIVYPHIPNKSIISKLIMSGYTVIINDNGDIPSDIIEMDEILFKKLTTANKVYTQ